MRMLIVEDNAVNREFLLAVLGRYGRCEAAETAEEGVELFRSALDEGNPYELVFMDVLLPGMNGLQALETLRETERLRGIPENRRAKVIVASALDDDRKAARAFFQGQAASYIAKPLSMSRLLDELSGLGLIERG